MRHDADDQRFASRRFSRQATRIRVMAASEAAIQSNSFDNCGLCPWMAGSIQAMEGIRVYSAATCRPRDGPALTTSASTWRMNFAKFSWNIAASYAAASS
jgi:hypothetical protein